MHCTDKTRFPPTTAININNNNTCDTHLYLLSSRFRDDEMNKSRISTNRITIKKVMLHPDVNASALTYCLQTVSCRLTAAVNFGLLLHVLLYN